MAAMVELSTAFQIALAIVAFLGGWFVKILFDRIKKLEDADKDLSKDFSEMRSELTKAITDLRVELPTNYTNKSEFKAMGDNIFKAIRELGADMRSGLQRGEEKLDQKADKP